MQPNAQLRLVLLVGSVLIATSITAAGELATKAKKPVPDAEAQQTARTAAGEVFGTRFAQAKTTAEKTALANDLMDTAANVQAGSVDQYVLLKTAADIAAGAGDAPTALQAVEKLVEWFDLPRPKLMAETLLAASSSATTSSQHKAIGSAVLSVVDAVADVDEYELALDLCETARSSARRTKQFALTKDLTTTIEAIEKRKKAFQEYKDASHVLDKDPTDMAANLAVGRYQCFVRGNWESGVAKLALSGDATLKTVAMKDLRGGDTPQEQAEIGDAWWDLAETKQGSERDILRLRSGFWYRQAEPQLAGGLAGLKLKQRLAELVELDPMSRLKAVLEGARSASSPTENNGRDVLVDTAPSPMPHVSLFRFKTFSWDGGKQSTRLIPTKDGFCFLSMVTGSFMGGGEAIAVATGPDSWWYLNGKSQQWCRAQAIAAESEDIKLSPTLTVVWKPANGRVRVINGQKGFCYLSGICGALRGAGEAVHITLEQDGWWYISGKSRIFLHAMATCVPWPPHRLQPKVTFFTWRRGDQPVKMIPKNEGFCVLTGIGGGFHGGAERVEISLGPDDFWYLKGSSMQSATFAEAIGLQFVKESR
jgi:hypothetical protein